VLEPFGITRYYADYWGAYTHPLDTDEHQPGKRKASITASATFGPSA